MGDMADFYIGSWAEDGYLDDDEEIDYVPSPPDQIFKVDQISAETKKAWLVFIDGKEHWLPKSACVVDENKMTAFVPGWLVSRKGLTGGKVI